MITLSQQQKDTVEGAIEHLRMMQEVSIAGLAGTGKTTIASSILDSLKEIGHKPLVLTPTGKAANVLRSKGVNADTIHSAIYNYKGKYVDEVSGNEYMAWEEKDELESTASVIMVDEASMVDARVADDLRNLGTKIIWVGDHGQLPPVGKDPGIMRHPDFVLKEVFRQKGNAGLLNFAYDARSGVIGRAYENVDFVKPSISELIKHDFDQAICGFNSTRIEFNRAYRKSRSFKKLFVEGEKLICLHNNRRQGIFNGMQFTVKEVMEYGDEDIHILADVDGKDRQLYISREGLNNINPNTELVGKNQILADYAYAITCHKSQGSEWNNVLVINQNCKAWDQNRWLYTAATRAKSKLMLAN